MIILLQIIFYQQMHPDHCLLRVFQVIAVAEKQLTYFAIFRFSKKRGLSISPQRGAEAELNVNVAVLCFVDFDNPECPATAMEALQEYRFDEKDRDSPSLKLQFARAPMNGNRNGSSFARGNGRNGGQENEYRRR